MQGMHVKMVQGHNVLLENIVKLDHHLVQIVQQVNIVMLEQVVAQIVPQVSGQMQDHQVVH